jgi:hypothetical protein
MRFYASGGKIAASFGADSDRIGRIIRIFIVMLAGHRSRAFILPAHLAEA